MISRATLLWAALVIPAGAALYQIKYEVRDLESEITGLERQIETDREAISVLRAEWSLLNDPQRIESLSRRHLGLEPVEPEQIKSADRLEEMIEPEPEPERESNAPVPAPSGRVEVRPFDAPAAPPRDPRFDPRMTDQWAVRPETERPQAERPQAERPLAERPLAERPFRSRLEVTPPNGPSP